MTHPAPGEEPENGTQTGYLRRWLSLRRAAWFYLLHAALLTGSLAMYSLVFNLAVVALDFPPLVVLGQEIPFLGVLGSLSVLAAGIVALPLLWLVNRIGFWWALVLNALLQASSLFIFALLPQPAPMLVAVALTGMGSVLFQSSSVPFIMRLSDEATRDHLFSANFAVNFGVAGLGRLLAGLLAEHWFPQQLGSAAGSAPVYQAIFATAGVGMLLSLVPLFVIAAPRKPSAAPDSQPVAPPSPPSPPRAPAEMPPGAQREELPRSPLLRGVLRMLRFIPEPWYSLVRHPWPLLRLMISPLLISFGAAVLFPYMNLFFSRRFDLTDDLLGLIFAAIDITIGLAALAGPSLSIRIGKMPTIVLAQVLSLPFLLALGFVPLLWVAVLAGLVRAGLFNMISPLYDAFAMERTEEPLRPTVIGAINGAFAAAYIVMPLVSTRVQQDYGFAPLFATTAVCYLLAACANYWLFVRRR